MITAQHYKAICAPQDSTVCRAVTPPCPETLEPGQEKLKKNLYGEMRKVEGVMCMYGEQRHQEDMLMES